MTSIRKIYFRFYAIVVNRCASVELPYPPSASERFEAIPWEHLPKKRFRHNGRPLGVLPLTCLVCRSTLVHFASRAAGVLRLLPQMSHARTPKDVGEKGTLSPCTPGSCGWLFGLVTYDVAAPLKVERCAIGQTLASCFPPSSSRPTRGTRWCTVLMVSRHQSPVPVNPMPRDPPNSM